MSLYGPYPASAGNAARFPYHDFVAENHHARPSEPHLLARQTITLLRFGDGERLSEQWRETEEECVDGCIHTPKSSVKYEVFVIPNAVATRRKKRLRLVGYLPHTRNGNHV